MKIMILVFTILILPLTGCGGVKKPFEYTTRASEPVCDDESIPLRAEFTLQCIANANPKSDEEPEDWIHQCEDMATELYCKDVFFDSTYITTGSKKNFSDMILTKTEVTVYQSNHSDGKQPIVDQDEIDKTDKPDETPHEAI